MTRLKKRILDVDVQFISLCPRGKNLLSTLYKSEGAPADAVSVETLVKDDMLDEQGQLTSIVYAPGMIDSEGYAAGPEVCRKMCHTFMRNGAKLDLRHNLKQLSKEDAYVSEAFVISKEQSEGEFAGMVDRLGRPVNTEGAFAFRVQIDNESLRKEYREGKWNGVSLYGPATVETVAKSADPVDSIIESLAERLGAKSQVEEIDMNKEELVETLTENNKGLVKSITEGLGEVLAKALGKGNDSDDKEGGDKPQDKTETLKFEGDNTNPEDIQKHLKKLRLHQLQKSVDWNDPESIAKYQEALVKMDEESDDDNDTSEEIAEKSEAERLRKKVEKLEKASTQTGKNEKSTVKGYEHLSKEDAELAQAADRVADWLNGEG